MFKKISRAILIALLILNSLIVDVSAAKYHEYYTLDISTLDDDVKPYISLINNIWTKFSIFKET